MFGLLAEVPLLWRWVAIAALAASAFAAGAALAYKWEGAKLEAEKATFSAYRSRSAALAAVQTARASRLELEATANDKKTREAYRADLHRIRLYYAGRLRARAALRTASGSVSPVSGAAGGAHARAANPTVAEPRAALEEACTETTAQLVALQDWIREQAAIAAQK